MPLETPMIPGAPSGITPSTQDKDLLDYSDYDAVRANIESSVLRGVTAAFPYANDTHTLRLADLNYEDKRFSIKDQKEALMKGKTLSKRLKGRWELVDNASGNVLKSSKNKSIIAVPYITDRGTFIRNGSEYTVTKQFRLASGVYHKAGKDGSFSAQINAKPGTGAGFSVGFDPTRALFHAKMQGKKVYLYPMLKQMGYSDEALQASWGKEIFDKNKATAKSPHTVKYLEQFRKMQKTAATITGAPAMVGTEEEEKESLLDRLARTELDSRTTQATMGTAYDRVNPTLLHSISNNLLSMAKGEREADNRDSLQFQTIHDAGDFFRERIENDKTRVVRKTLNTLIHGNGDMDKIPSGVLTDYVDNFFNTAGLTQPIEAINPLDAFDQNQRVQRLGEYGMSSLDVAPDESRNVQNSYFGFVDPVRSPECYDKYTEVMTEEGWVKFSDVREDTSFACMQDNAMFFHKASTLFVDHYEGTLYGAKTAYADFLVTMEHRMWSKSLVGKKEYKISPVSDVFGKDIALQSGGHTFSDDPHYIDICEMHYKNHFSCRETIDIHNECDLRDIEETLFALGKAYKVNKRRDGYWTVVLTSDTLEVSDQNASGGSNYYTEEYNDNIYCATVPGGLLYVRRKGSVGFWCGNSLKIGLDMRFARGIRKGRDNKLYKQFINAKTGKKEWVDMHKAAVANVAESSDFMGKNKYIPTIAGDKIEIRNRKDVDYYLEGDDLFSEVANIVPGKSGVKGMRLLMGSKFASQALPLVGREAPLVRTSASRGSEFSQERRLGNFLGASRAKQDGTVTKLDKNAMTIKYADGTEKVIDLYESFPFARKTYKRSIAKVAKGDTFKKGDALVTSNFTDDMGVAALGKNMRIGYMDHEGLTFEDANVVSESAAKTHLTSEHMYTTAFEPDTNTTMGKNKFKALYPTQFSKEQLDSLGEDGVVKPGTVLKKGDPIVLGYNTKEGSGITKKLRSDASKVWKHPFPGVVTGAALTHTGNVSVNVRANVPAKVGDKLSGRFGNKGVIAKIIPDDEMPVGSDGKALEILMSPLGLISRCYDAETEFLTQDGWKLGKDVLDSDKLLSVDPSTGVSEMQSQYAPFHRAEYKGKIYGASEVHLDFRVTHNHKMWARNEWAGFDNGNSEGEFPVQRLAQSGRWFLPTIGLPVTGVDTPFELPHLPEYSVKDTQSNKDDILLNPGDWAEFLGWFLSEGHSVYRTPEDHGAGKYEVCISQCNEFNPEKCEQITDLLNRLPFGYKYNKHNGCFIIRSKRLAHYCKQFGLCDEKFVPYWLFTQSLATRERYLDSMFKGDGYPGTTNTGKTKTLGLTSEQLIDDTQRLIILSGTAAIKRDMKVKEGGGRNGAPYKPMYRCAVQLKKRERMMKKNHWIVEDYEGTVYCPSVPFGYVLTRRNGKILVAGNTNSSQITEAMLGKVARLTGKHYNLDGFKGNYEDLITFAEQELEKNGLKAEDTILDPRTGKHIESVLTGTTFIHKLQHTSESKGKSRATAGYDENGQPSKGGKEGAKHFGCFPGTQKVLTMHGERSISSIVEKKQSEQVWTFCEDSKQWCYKPVTDWFTYRAPVSDIIRIEIEGASSVCGNKRIKHTSVLNPTKNHKIFTYDGRKIDAGELKVGDDMISWGPIASDIQKQALLGSLLGDAYMSAGSYQVMHSAKQSGYVEFKQSILSGLYSSWSRISDTDGHRRVLLSLANKQVARMIEDLCYDGTSKVVTRDWLNAIGPLGLAMWLLDDGYLTNRSKKKGGRALAGELATNGFSLKEVDIIIDYFQDIFGEDSATKTLVSGGTQAKVSFRARTCEKLVRLIAEWVPSEAIPKSKIWLRKEVALLQESVPAKRVSGLSAIGKVPCPVRSITPYVDPKGRDEINVYDFTVNDTHKYTAGNVLVSNSMEVQALLGHNVPNVLKDMKLIKGQRNDDFWKSVRMGQNPKMPETPLVYKKFRDMLTATGITISDTQKGEHIFAMTNKEALKLTGERRVRTPDTLSQKDMTPIKGGLFDEDIAGKDGSKWGYIDLPTPLLNPVMEDPIKRMLGLTQKGFNSLISTGKLGETLEGIDIDKEIERARNEVKVSTKGKRDAAIKRLGSLQVFQQKGVHPTDFMMSRIPVLPPRFRPISQQRGVNMVNDANYMYSAMMYAGKDYIDAQEGSEELKEEAADNLYKHYKALTGLADPVQQDLKDKEVGGILKLLTGKGSPKYSFIQRKVISTNIDTSGLGVIVPNSKLDMDQVGIPEKLAWELYEPFVTRELVKSGMPAMKAASMVANREKRATDALQKAMDSRPVLVNRAPTLHKYGIMAFKPRIVKGHAIHTSPLIVGPFGADYDGDSVLNMISIRITLNALNEGSEVLDNSVNTPIINDVTGIMNPCNHDINEDVDMKFDKDTKVITKTAMIRIEDIPYIEGTGVNKSEHITEWDVPEGIEVYGYDRETRKHGYHAVTKLSKHEGLPMLDITVGSKGRNQSMITSSADHSLIFYNEEGEVVDGTPRKAEGMYVPVARKVEDVSNKRPRRNITIGNSIPMSEDLGKFIGCMIGDGWVASNNQVLVASIYPELKKFLADFVDNSQIPQRSSSGYHNADRDRYSNGGFGSKSREGNYTAERVEFHIKTDAAKDLANLIGKGDENKTIPWQCLEGTAAHMRGILAGLIATDGTVSVGKTTSKKSPTKTIAYDTTSPYLRDAAQLLLRKLGIGSSVTTYRGRHSTKDCYRVSISVLDFCKMYKANPSFNIPREDNQNALDEMLETVDFESNQAQALDVVPYPKHLFEVLSYIGQQGATGINPSEMSSYRSKGGMSRIAAKKIVAVAEEMEWQHYKTPTHLKKIDRKNYSPFEALAEFDRWAEIVKDETISWQKVMKVEDAGVRDCWDMTVPGPLTFALSSGVIVMDTMSVSVPTTQKAVDEAREKMMPSKHLISARDGSANYTPSNEFLMGLYYASKGPRKGDKVQYFSSIEELKEAYKKGLVHIDSPVQIKGQK